MITIQILGLDPFVVGHYSKDHTANLAQLFEVEEDQLSFFSPDGMMFHNGVEQTSWDTLVIVRAPKECHALEDAVVDYIFKTLTQFSINVTVEFDYFERHHHHEKIHPDYPRFISPDQIDPNEYNDDRGYDPNLYNDDDEDEETEEAHPGHEHHHHHEHEHEHEEVDINDEESIFLGNAFEGFEEELEALDPSKKK